MTISASASMILGVRDHGKSDERGRDSNVTILEGGRKERPHTLSTILYVERMNWVGLVPRAFTPGLRFLHCCEFFFFFFL